jgi:cytochrome c553
MRDARRRTIDPAGTAPAQSNRGYPNMNVAKAIISSLATALIALAVAGAAHAQGAGDPARGATKVQMCQGCHGIEGWRTAFPEVYQVPRIAGQHEAYLVKALQEYKNGERSHPSMRAVAASLTDGDMADVAAYYAQGGPSTHTK